MGGEGCMGQQGLNAWRTLMEKGGGMRGGQCQRLQGLCSVTSTAQEGAELPTPDGTISSL